MSNKINDFAVFNYLSRSLAWAKKDGFAKITKIVILGILTLVSAGFSQYPIVVNYAFAYVRESHHSKQ